MNEEQFMRWYIEVSSQEYSGKTYNLTDALIRDGLI